MLNVITFFLGVLSIYFIAERPDFSPYLVIPVLILFWIFLPALRWFFSYFLGFFWMLLAVGNVLEQELPKELISKTVSITGIVSSLPEDKQNRTRFDFLIEEMHHEGKLIPGPKKVRLNWYGREIKINAGEKWRLDVRLKPAKGMANPGGFDYERWLFENKITAKGYVYGKGQTQLLAEPPWYSVNHWRQALRDKINNSSLAPDHMPLINALLIGDRSQVTEQQWHVLSATGTNHLLAISGLHIGLVAGVFYWIVYRLFRKSKRLLLYLPAYKIAAIGSMFAAIVYAAMAGFSIPTQRALIMIGVALLLMVMNRRINSSKILAIAVLCVLLFDPLSVLSVSFWLSFAAVAIIVFSVQSRLETTSLWWQYGKIQWVISLAMIPIVLYAFQSFSVVSPLANLLAVPWVSFVVVPLVFLAAIFSMFLPVFEFILQVVNYSLEILWWVLELFSSWSLAKWYGNIPNIWVLLLSLIGAALLISPKGLPVRLPGFVLFLLIFFVAEEEIEKGGFKLVQLDVGQGLSSVIQTGNHILVYDAGAKFSESFDMGSAVIVPYLRTINKHQIDSLIISHGDNDHIGGMNSLIEKFSVMKIYSGVMEKTPFNNAIPCTKGSSWVWDGVKFEILHPDPKHKLSDNNGSCVLKISNHSHSVLLTGDIEKKAEKLLLVESERTLDVDVIVAPHHGSKTSSTLAFIEATSPEWVIFPAGFLNRFGFPKQTIVDRYESKGSKTLTTGVLGAITLTFNPLKAVKYTSYRNQNPSLWN